MAKCALEAAKARNEHTQKEEICNRFQKSASMFKALHGHWGKGAPIINELILDSEEHAWRRMKRLEYYARLEESITGIHLLDDDEMKSQKLRGDPL